MKTLPEAMLRSRALAVAAALWAGALCGPGTSVALAQQSPAARTIHQATAESRLHVAARTGDLPLLRAQLKNGVSANLRDSSGRTALMEAAEAGQIQAARLLIQSGADVNAGSRTGTALAAAERAGHMDIAALLRESGARSTGHSLGDTVCVRPWAGEGYCGVVEGIDRNTYKLRVTEIVGCKNGCAARAQCSADRIVGGPGGISVGDTVETVSSCLTHTGVQR